MPQNTPENVKEYFFDENKIMITIDSHVPQ